MLDSQFIIIGGGIAGAAVAYWLAPHADVVLLERESQPGYHTTGRSAALFMESYGPPQVRALNSASRAFLERPPAGFAETPLVMPRGALMVAAPGQEAELEAHWKMLRAMKPSTTSLSATNDGATNDGATKTVPRRLDAAQTCAMVPVLRPERVIGATYEPDPADMDVHAIHQGYLRGLRQAGGRLVCNAEVDAIERAGERWRVEAGGVQYEASVVINAAGAWVDAIAQLAGAAPIGIEPRRRSAFIFVPPAGVACADWPMVIGVCKDWYFKPDAGMLLGSPANADPTVPHDVQPEELDIALAIHRIEEATTLTVRRPTRTWAGLRSFVADGNLVGGFDDAAPGFFWVAAQGGYGIQTSPAMGEACAALARGLPLPARIASFGLTAEMLAPARLRKPA